MKLSKKSKCLLICLLVILVIVVRLPSYPHERGSADEFAIHAVADSVSESGYAKWWMNPWCVFGLYPYSYGSAPPFLFSGASQCTGMSMESCAWILCAIFGVFIMLSAYIMAGKIRDDDTSKFLVAFFVSVSQGVLTYTTWQVSARGTFLAFLPLFIFLILNMRNFRVRDSALVLIILAFLASTHHYVYFTIPIIVAFIVAVVVYKLSNADILSTIKVPEIVPSMVLATALVVAFSIPFIMGIFISTRYDDVQYLLLQSIRYSGPLLPVAIGGVFYLIFKRKKELGEVFAVLFLIFFTPLMYAEAYYPYFGAILLGTFVGVGVANLGENKIDKKRMLTVMIIFLIVFSGFSAFYQHYRTSPRVHTFYMEEPVYNTGAWLKNNLHEGRMISNDGEVATRILSVSEVPILSLPFPDLVYGFVDVNEDIKVVRNSPLSEEFYRDNPYVLSPEVPCYMYYHYALQRYDIDSGRSKSLINRKNITHVIEGEYFGDNTFIRSIHVGKYDEIFSNGKVKIWSITGS